MAAFSQASGTPGVALPIAWRFADFPAWLFATGEPGGQQQPGYQATASHVLIYILSPDAPDPPIICEVGGGSIDVA